MSASTKKAATKESTEEKGAEVKEDTLSADMGAEARLASKAFKRDQMRRIERARWARDSYAGRSVDHKKFGRGEIISLYGYTEIDGIVVPKFNIGFEAGEKNIAGHHRFLTLDLAAPRAPNPIVIKAKKRPAARKKTAAKTAATPT